LLRSENKLAENAKTAGFMLIILKNEKGAKFETPFSETVEIHPMGRGATMLIKSL